MTNGLPTHGTVIERAIVLGDGIIHGVVTRRNEKEVPHVIYATVVRTGGPGSNGERQWKVVQTLLLDFVHPCTFPILEPDNDDDDEANGDRNDVPMTDEQLAQQIADFWRPCECFVRGDDDSPVERAEAALGRTFPFNNNNKPDGEFMTLLGTPSLCCRQKILITPTGHSRWFDDIQIDSVARAIRTVGVGLAGAGVGVAISTFGGPISLGVLGATAAAYWYGKTIVPLERKSEIEMF